MENNFFHSKTMLFSSVQKYFDQLLNKIDCFTNAKEIVLPPILDSNSRLAQEYQNNFKDLATKSVSDSTSSTINLLAPACCYTLFQELSDHSIKDSTTFTVKSYIFRNESYFERWKRERVFLMREYIQIGTKENVENWIEDTKNQVLQLLNLLGLEVQLSHATDLFFNPNSFQKKVQKEYQLKQEFIINDIAVGSINNHINSFGKKCNINVDDTFAYSACFGLGYNRLLYALCEKHGESNVSDFLKSLI